MQKKNQEKNVVDPTPHQPGHTTPELHDGLAPRLPHERDESSDSQPTEQPQAQAEHAAKDASDGAVDTDRGPVLDEVYEHQVRPGAGATRDRGTPAPRSNAKGDDDGA